MSDRRPTVLAETITEAIRAALALMAVVLLARHQANALSRSPALWVGLVASLIAWGAATGAARLSPTRRVSRLSCWRDCVAPALLTLLLLGRGQTSSLSIAIGLIAMGSVAVAMAPICCRQTLVQVELTPPVRSPGTAGDSSIGTPNRVEPSVPAPETITESESETPAESLPRESIGPESRLSGSFALLPQTERVEVEADAEETLPAESWTRTESDGEVSIEAVVHARFADGSKLAVLHLPFVPPLPALPQIECEPLESGCEVNIQTEAAYRHGARLSVTRLVAGPAESVPIGVVVYTTAEEAVE